MAILREEYKIDLEKIPPGDLREQIENVSDFLDEQLFARAKCQLFQLTFTAASTNYRFKHQLFRIPKDAWVTYVTPDSGVTVTLNYDEFDKEYLDISVSAACTVRIIAGLFGG